jgi:hypothetical protein
MCPEAWRVLTREWTYGEDWLDGGPSSFTIWATVSFQSLHFEYLAVILTRICMIIWLVYVRAELCNFCRFIVLGEKQGQEFLWFKTASSEFRNGWGCGAGLWRQHSGCK